MPTDLNSLRLIAEKAAGSPWYYTITLTMGGRVQYNILRDATNSLVATTELANNARYIACLNPKIVLELIDRLELAEAELEKISNMILESELEKMSNMILESDS
jgi:hypothetical protein